MLYVTMKKVFVIGASVIVLFRCYGEVKAGNHVGFSSIDLHPGMTQYQTFMTEVGGGALGIEQFLKVADVGDKIVYDNAGEMEVAIAEMIDDRIAWIDLDSGTKLVGARLPVDNDGSRLIYKNVSGRTKSVTFAGEIKEMHNPSPMLFPPPPPRVVKLALPFKTRPDGQFYMVIRNNGQSIERRVVRLSDANTIVDAETGIEVACREKDVIGFEKIRPELNPLVDPKDKNLQQKDVSSIDNRWKYTIYLRQKALEVASMLKGEEVTWDAFWSSIVIIAITSIFGRICVFLGNVIWRYLLCLPIKFVFVYVILECRYFMRVCWLFRRMSWRI